LWPAGPAASSEDEFKPESDKSENEDDDDEDDELSVVESTSGSSPEESEIDTPEKVSFYSQLVIDLRRDADDTGNTIEENSISSSSSE